MRCLASQTNGSKSIGSSFLQAAVRKTGFTAIRDREFLPLVAVKQNLIDGIFLGSWYLKITSLQLAAL